MPPKRKTKEVVRELVFRLILLAVFIVSDNATPFERQIQAEEIWLYSFPRTPSYYPGTWLWLTVILVPLISFGVAYLCKKDFNDSIEGFLGTLLSFTLSGCVTNFIKLGVGRPRPDFMERCFPDKVFNADIKCSGKTEDIIEGRKSFPSGHASLSSSCLVFVALYFAGKLHVFTKRGRGKTIRTVLFIFPLVWATMIAISRTCDYHHHWQDVFVGSIIGYLAAYYSYRQHYPSLFSSECHVPYTSQLESVELPLHYEPKPSLEAQMKIV